MAKSQELTISSPQSRQKAVGLIKSLPEGEWTLKIWPWKQKKTSAQRRLNWKWNTEIGEQTGMSKGEVHEMLKGELLWRIFYRDDPGYARAIDATIRVKPHSKSDFDYLKAHILKNTHAEDCDVDQMAEFLTEIKRFCHEKELYITIPRDKDWEWLSEISEEKADQIKRAKAKRSPHGSMGAR
jgi:hypothetical protein